jgi:hypothetical protein
MILNLVSGHLWWGDCFIVTHQIFEDEDGESAPRVFWIRGRGKGSAPRFHLRQAYGATGSDRIIALPLAIRQTPYRYLSYFFRSVLNIRRASGVEPVSNKIADHRDKTPRQKPRNERPIFPAIFRLNPEAIAIICSPLPGGVGWRAN